MDTNLYSHYRHADGMGLWRYPADKGHPFSRHQRLPHIRWRSQRQRNARPRSISILRTLNPRPPHHSRQDFSSKRPYVHETQRRSTILPPSPKPQYTNPSPSNLHNSHPQPTTNPDLRPPPPHFPNASTPASNSLAHTLNPQLKPQQLSTPSQTPLSSPRICHRSIGNTNARHYS